MEVPPVVEAALHDAWYAATGAHHLSPVMVTALARDPESALLLIPRVAAVAEWRLGGRFGELPWLAGRLLEFAWRIYGQALTREDVLGGDVLGWVEVVAAAPGLDATAYRPVLDVTPTEVHRWSALGLAAGLAPLCHAAGLERREVVARYRAGGVTAEGVAVLAALRGYCFPPTADLVPTA